jgi:hypothetical protein
VGSAASSTQRLGQIADEIFGVEDGGSSKGDVAARSGLIHLRRESGSSAHRFESLNFKAELKYARAVLCAMLVRSDIGGERLETDESLRRRLIMN